jgi:hypothetical protein
MSFSNRVLTMTIILQRASVAWSFSFDLELNRSNEFMSSWLSVSSGTVYSSRTNSVALSPPANYTEGATATCRRNLVPTFADRGVSRGQRGGSLRSLISVF